MICLIAGLGVDVPPVGNMPERCEPYLADVPTDIVIDPATLRANRFTTLNEADNYYLDTGYQFYIKLLDHDGLMLHSSCVVVDGYAYLFSGPCGMGKSTHTAKYLKTFPDAVIINDDKPALRRIDGRWYAYGTPWCGKDGINVNARAPIAGICFLHRGDSLINRISPLEAFPQFMRMTNGRMNPERARVLIGVLRQLVTEVPFFDFYNHADEGAELITYSAMRSAMEEMEKNR